jgi:hypothetical protein
MDVVYIYFFQIADSWTSDRWMRKCTWKPAGLPASGTPSRSPFLRYGRFTYSEYPSFCFIYSFSFIVISSLSSSFYLKYFLLLEKLLFPDNTSFLYFSWKKKKISAEIPKHGTLLSAKVPTFSFLKNLFRPGNYILLKYMTSAFFLLTYCSLLFPRVTSSFLTRLLSPRQTTSSLTYCTRFSVRATCF